MNWKAISIIFIIFFVVETSFIIYLFSAGGKLADNENKCMYNICDGYGAYLYDDLDKVCYCYIDGEIKHSESVGRFASRILNRK